MLNFILHPDFEKETAKLKRRFVFIEEGIKSFQRLCEVQFHPIAPSPIIAPAKLHRITQNTLWSIWKIELVIPKSGLKPNQFPRLWFAVEGSDIAFLCLQSHIDNYKDCDIDKIALERVADIF